MNISLTRAQILQALENGMVTVQVFDPFNEHRVALPPPTPTVTDPRPEGWKRNFGYRFPSWSGASDGHEVTIGWKDGTGSSGYHCNCPAGGFGRDCWALKAVRNTVFGFRHTPDVIRSERGLGKRVNTSVNPSFGGSE